MLVADIIIESAAPSFDRKYSYGVPQDFVQVNIGCRVRVPFGRANKMHTGLVLGLQEENLPPAGLKNIAQIIDTEPLLNQEGIWLLAYLKDNTFCTWFDALRVLIPAGISVKEQYEYSVAGAAQRSLSDAEIEILSFVNKKKKPVSEKILCQSLDIAADCPELLQLVKEGILTKGITLKQKVLDDKILMVSAVKDYAGPLTARQKDVVSFLEENGEASYKEIAYYTAATRSVVETLSKKSAVEIYEFTRQRTPYENYELTDENNLPSLSQNQREVAEALIERMRKGEPEPALLYGVTGSGKTQVFLSLIADTLARGKKVIVMVPEISLTSQTVMALKCRFGGRVAVLHSALSLGERVDEWKRIKNGLADVVVGTRSAVFAPLENIGLIVIDEEQEHTYKSEKSPRYHARDVAYLRCKYHKGMLLLCSATPSVESYYKAKSGKYALCSLTERYGAAILPDVYVVDMGAKENLTISQNISEPLLYEIRYNLEHGEQTILLLNRRGYSTVVKCTDCNTAVQCPNCSIAMTYHMANESLICHYCGYTQKRTDRCPTCGSDVIKYSGVGTQKLEQEITMLFPNARVLRMDMDTTMAKFSHEKKFTSFLNGEYDILIGTQMVSKGLNFPRVTLVGVLSADQSLYADDFRSYERTFSLLTQVVGRSGRGKSPGRAFVQTHTPDHPIIRLAAEQDYESFYKNEIITRKNHLYSPFCTIASVGFTGENERETAAAAREFADKLTGLAKEKYTQLPLVVLGPSAADVLKVAGKYRYKLILKCRNDKPTRALLRETSEWFYQSHKKVGAFVDMYYDKL